MPSADPNEGLELMMVRWRPELKSRVGHLGAPGWLSGLSLCLRLGSWSQGPGIEPRVGLSARLSAYF